MPVCAANPATGTAMSSRADTAAAVTGDSIAVAGWTALSRATGVLRFAVIGAVLGPTFFGNTYQFTNSLPNLVFYGLLGGALFSSLLVPALVKSIDLGDRAGSVRLAGGFLGVAWLGLAVLVPVTVLAGPLALGAGQQGQARVLLALFVPQLFCYAVVATSVAVMNAHRRFALAAGAPAIENLGIIAVLLAIGDPSRIVPLGIGTTLAVVLHAAVQWAGARRAGVTLVPRAGWRDPEARTLIRRAVPSVIQAALAAGQLVVLLAIANRVPGGVVAFQLALSFCYVINALGAVPFALAALPRLARMHRDGDRAGFAGTLAGGLSLGLFVTVPVAVIYFVMAGPLAGLVSAGRMGPGGTALIAAALAGLAAAVIGETIFSISTYASYAREDTRSPLWSTVVGAGTCLTVASLALPAEGTAVLAILGLAYSAGAVAAAIVLSTRIWRDRAPARRKLLTSAGRTAAGAVVLAGPAWLTSVTVPDLVGAPLGTGAGLLAAVCVAAGLFLAVQVLLRAPELALVAGGFKSLRGRS